MNPILRILTKRTGERVKNILLEHVQCPLLTCNKISYGYLNNDWIMVSANLAVLALTIVFLFAGALNVKGISG